MTIQEQPAWRKVKDDPPEIEQRVLAYIPRNESIFRGFCKLYKTDYCEKYEWYVENPGQSTKRTTEIVSHWMPLPKPPEVTQDG